MNDEKKKSLIVVAIVVLVGLLFSHFIFGRTITHIIIIGLVVLAYNVTEKHYTDKINEAEIRSKIEEERKEAEAIAQENEKKRRKEERHKTIREAAEAKALTYISDMRRAIMRLDGSNENASKVAIALDEILNNISIDPEIDNSILSNESIHKETKILRECLENSLLKDHLVIKRFDKIL